MSRQTHHRRATRLAAGLALAALGLAACGGGDDGGSANDAAETDTTAAVDTTDQAQGDDAEPVSLTVWSFQPLNYDGGEEAYQAVVDGFMAANPNIEVEMVAIPFDTYWDQLRNATIAGQGPDIVSMYGGTTAAGYPGSFVALQDVLSSDTLSELKYVDSSIGPDGNLYALPTGAYAYNLTVNTALLDQAGLSVDDLATWDGLLGACSTLSDAGISPVATGWSDGYQLETLLYMLTSQILDEDGLSAFNQAKIGFDDPRFETAMNHVLDLNEAGCFADDTLGLALYDDGFAQITAGDASLFTAGSAQTAIDADSDLGAGTMAIIPLPQVPESAYADAVDSGPEVGWSIMSWTGHQDAAAKFLEYMASAETQSMLSDAVGIPSNVAASDGSADDALTSAYLDLIASPNAHTTFMAFTQPALAIFEREASNLIAGRTDATEVLKLADEAQRRALSELGD